MKLVFLTALFFLGFTPKVMAQFVQQGNKLVGSGAINDVNMSGVFQGQSVSVSSDGNTAIVGGNYDNTGTGAAWIWIRSGGIWSQQGSKLIGTGAVAAAQQGYAVAISSDGNTAIVGGWFDGNSIGAAWVWTRSGGVWSQQGGKLIGSGSNYASQGWSVSLSSDGNTAIVGGYADNSGTGAAWVWTRTGGVWTQQGSKLVGSGAVNGGNGAQQGYSVALSSDGNTAMVGGNLDNSQAGAAWVWTRSGGVWTQQGNKLVGTGAVNGGTGAQQGRSVSLSPDGNTAIIGGPVDNSQVGAAWVWTRSGGVWTQQGGKLVATDGVGTGYQGFSVSLSSNGNTALIGGFTDNGQTGAAWAWTRSGGIWTQLGNKLLGAGAVSGSNGIWQGRSVSLSTDGNTAIVGGSNDNSGIGAAWVYTRQTTPVLPKIFAVRRLNLVNGKFLRFSLPQTERVEIQLLNIEGQTLLRLLDETRKAGYYTIPLPAGLRGPCYLLDFRAGYYRRILKIYR